MEFRPHVVFYNGRSSFLRIRSCGEYDRREKNSEFEPEDQSGECPEKIKTFVTGSHLYAAVKDEW